MNDDSTSALRLHHLKDFPSDAKYRLIDHFGDAKSVFDADFDQLVQVLGDRPNLARRFKDVPPDESVRAGVAWARQPGCRIIGLGTSDYPAALAQIEKPPIALYTRGNATILNQPTIAVVGSRHCTAAGAEFAFELSEQLAGVGFNVVSGLACGIDRAAHEGAISSTGSTIAVFGTGIDRVYPTRHEALAEKVAYRGVLLSEFSVGTPPKRYHFPRRNRLISGLSYGVIVVEASRQSGSLLTASYALEQGRDIFAVPGSRHSAVAKGCHYLIKEGAKLIECAQDVLEEYPSARFAGLSRPLSEAHAGVDAEDDDPEIAFLRNIDFSPTPIDRVIERSGLTTERVSSMLLALELEGKVTMTPAGPMRLS